MSSNLSGFDKAAFLAATTTEQGSTVTVPVPASDGNGWLAVITNVDARPWQGKADPSKSGIALDIEYTIDEPKVKEALGRDKVTVTQGVMLDMVGSSIDWSKGKNVQLARVREAVGQNTPGVPWAPQMLVGRPCRVVIGHRASDRPQDPPGTMFADVNGVVKA